MEHPIETLMSTTMDQLKTMVKTNTVIGEPIESPDGSMIIPVTKVGFGFAAGGSDIEKKGSSGSSQDEMPFCGGGGGGVSISPVAFMVISDSGVKLIQLDENTKIYEKMLEEAPNTIGKLQKVLKGAKGGKKPDRRSARHEQDSEE